MRALLFLLFSITARSAVAQELSLKDLRYILEHNPEQAGTYLEAAGFHFYKSEECDIENCPCKKVYWTFDRTNDHSVAFVGKHCINSKHGGIFYQTVERTTYESIKIACKASGCKQVKDYTTEDGYQRTLMEGNIYTFLFTLGFDNEKNYNIYVVTVYLK
jgi:hypothetical protein